MNLEYFEDTYTCLIAALGLSFFQGYVYIFVCVHTFSAIFFFVGNCYGTLHQQKRAGTNYSRTKAEFNIFGSDSVSVAWFYCDVHMYLALLACFIQPCLFLYAFSNPTTVSLL